MTTRRDYETFVLTIKVDAQQHGGPDAIQRLRRLLKAMVRHYGLRLTDFSGTLPPIDPEIDPCKSEPPFAPPLASPDASKVDSSIVAASVNRDAS